MNNSKNLYFKKLMFSCQLRRCTSSANNLGLKKDLLHPMPKTPVIQDVETGWYEWWEANNFFKTKLSSKKFVLLLPPPNVTGKLHMGHALTCSIQDALIRWHSMKGHEVLWVPGSDHAGIATQVVVEKHLLKTKNQSKYELGRERFLEEVHQWTEEKSSTIKEQLRRLGIALDWQRDTFTLDPTIRRAVTEAIRRLHQDGLLYRSKMMINWCSTLQSAVSDSEVDHISIESPKNIQVPGHKNAIKFGYMYEIGYQIQGSKNETIEVSTTRPETILGDTAIMVNPEDTRFQHLHGKQALHPLTQRLLPIITDSEVDMTIGTGAVKVTPCHSFQDYEVGRRHKLPLVEILNDKGCIIGTKEIEGMPRFSARGWVLDRLADKNLFKSKKVHSFKLPMCSRSGDVIEPRLKDQWFIKMDSLSRAAIEAVDDERLKLRPSNSAINWKLFLGEGRDWCISRQLWWGHRMPIYWASSRKDSTFGCEKEISEGNSAFVVADNEKEALNHAATQLGIDTTDVKKLIQESDVLDTWFSSGLWPFAVFGWPELTSDLKKYYPISLMETGHDILFFWVARMVILGLHLTKELPFKEVLLHSLVCDSDGHKMSKSKGNVVDPMDIIEGYQKEGTKKSINVPGYGADALRMSLLSRDFKQATNPFDMNSVQQNNLFRNKMWQTIRFLIHNVENIDDSLKQMQFIDPSRVTNKMDLWILSQLYSTMVKVNKGFEIYDLNESISALKTFWHSYLCDVYLEAIKPRLWHPKDVESTNVTLRILFTCCHSCIVALSPFMPFLTEELYQYLPSCRTKETSVMKCSFPLPLNFEQFEAEDLQNNTSLLLNVFSSIRSLRKTLNVATKVPKGEAVVYIADDSLRSLAIEIMDESSKLSLLERLSFLPEYQMPSELGIRTIRQRISEGVVLDFPIQEDLDVEVEVNRFIKKVKKLETRIDAGMKNLTKLKECSIEKDILEKQIANLKLENSNVKIFINVLQNCK